MQRYIVRLYQVRSDFYQSNWSRPQVARLPVTTRNATLASTHVSPAMGVQTFCFYAVACELHVIHGLKRSFRLFLKLRCGFVQPTGPCHGHACPEFGRLGVVAKEAGDHRIGHQCQTGLARATGVVGRRESMPRAFEFHKFVKKPRAPQSKALQHRILERVIHNRLETGFT